MNPATIHNKVSKDLKVISPNMSFDNVLDFVDRHLGNNLKK